MKVAAVSAIVGIEVHQGADGYMVVIPNEDGGEFARTFSRDLGAALAQAASYVDCVLCEMAKRTDAQTEAQLIVREFIRNRTF